MEPELDDSYESQMTFDSLRETISKYLNPHDRILIIGFGNGVFPADLYDNGFHNVVAIDVSKDVIDRMVQLQNSHPQVSWMEMNPCSMNFADSSFDVVIDRHTMDKIVAHEGSVWDPDQIVVVQVDQMCREISRVLSHTGLFFQISLSQPHFRTKYLMGQHYENTVINPYGTTQGFCKLYDWIISFSKLGIARGCIEAFLYLASKE